MGYLVFAVVTVVAVATPGVLVWRARERRRPSHDLPFVFFLDGDLAQAADDASPFRLFKVGDGPAPGSLTDEWLRSLWERSARDLIVRLGRAAEADDCYAVVAAAHLTDADGPGVSTLPVPPEWVWRDSMAHIHLWSLRRDVLSPDVVAGAVLNRLVDTLQNGRISLRVFDVRPDRADPDRLVVRFRLSARARRVGRRGSHRAVGEVRAVFDRPSDYGFRRLLPSTVEVWERGGRLCFSSYRVPARVLARVESELYGHNFWREAPRLTAAEWFVARVAGYR